MDDDRPTLVSGIDPVLGALDDHHVETLGGDEVVHPPPHTAVAADDDVVVEFQDHLRLTLLSPSIADERVEHQVDEATRRV